MKRLTSRVGVLSSVLLCAPFCLADAATSADVPQLPRVFVLDGARISQVRARIQNGDHAFDGALAKLKADADKAMTAGPFAVTQKGVLPPSRDKHDYLSQGIYWWPNPDTPDGLPYVNHDGKINPETKKITDETQMLAMSRAVEPLAQSWYFTGNREHANRAALLLRTWFLDEATRMNPHLKYAQFVPAVAPEGRYSGIVDTESLVKIPDAIGLLADAPTWTPDDQKGMQKWFGAYADWLADSKAGQQEGRSPNNHGTVYDAQLASFALFAGKQELAERVLNEVKTRRIAKLIEPDGSQPSELKRTKAWTYSNKNLQSLFWLASMGDKVGIDLWHFQTEDGRGIQKALDFLIPFASAEKEWTYQRLDLKPDQKPKLQNSFLRRAALKFNDARYNLLLEQAAPDFASERDQLLWPLA